MTRVVAALVAAASVLLVAGCSESSPGQAAPMPTTSSANTASDTPSTSTLPHSGAPAVEDPLPKSAMTGDPCTALTRQQVEEALGDNASTGQRDDIATGPTCEWKDTTSGAGFMVFFGTVVGEGLSSYYQNTKPQSGTWRELSSVEGFPAVAFQSKGNDLTCQVTVGLADEYTVAVGSSPGRGAEITPCELSQKLAEVVVQNLKQKAGR